MIVRCRICEAAVSEEAAVRIGRGADAKLYCSARCADRAGPEADVGLAELPAAPRHILVAVDGSGPSLRAVQMAARLASMSEGRVRLLQAVEAGWMRPLSLAALGEGAVGVGVSSEEVADALREDAEAQLERCKRICSQAGVPATGIVVFGPPLPALMQEAAAADLIVMGSRGLGALATAFVGSLSQRVIASARIPVLVVH